jgi:hypothetical protein
MGSIGSDTLGLRISPQPRTRLSYKFCFILIFFDFGWLVLLVYVDERERPFGRWYALLGVYFL